MNETVAATLWTWPQADEVEQFATLELQRYLKQMTGREIVLRQIPVIPHFPVIFMALGVGEPPETWLYFPPTLSGDGYHLRGYPSGAALEFPISRGLLYAAYGLLKHLGAPVLPRTHR